MKSAETSLVAHRSEVWTAVRRVLCVRLDGMGDVLMTTPAIAALQAGGRHVTLLASPAGAQVARLVPEIDEVITYDAPWMKATLPREAAAPDLALVRRLAEQRFDAAAIFTVYSQSALPAALLCHLASIPLRLGHCRENPHQLLTDWLPDPEPLTIVRHEVRRQLDLVASVGAAISDERLRLRVPREARESVHRLLADAGVSSGQWILVHPGATAPSRRYPPDMLAEACRALASLTGRTIVLAGSVDETGILEEMRTGIGRASVSLGGALDVAGLAALVEAAPLLIGNNSGPIHIAAAVRTPVVDLYALTNPQHTPWAVKSRVLSNDVPCKYCYKSVCPEGHHACLRGVAPEDVVRAALSLLPPSPP
jgi:lipopolysaccharide heptosyltransferase II